MGFNVLIKHIVMLSMTVYMVCSSITCTLPRLVISCVLLHRCFSRMSLTLARESSQATASL